MISSVGLNASFQTPPIKVSSGERFGLAWVGKHPWKPQNKEEVDASKYLISEKGADQLGYSFDLLGFKQEKWNKAHEGDQFKSERRSHV